MKKYQIYGIGGALVDIEVEVSEKFLENAGISKGIMTLVDESRQNKLLNNLMMEDKTIIRGCGGSVCNSIVAASMLGSETFFSGKVANDSDGNVFIDQLKKAGVNFHSARRESGTTGKCLVLVTLDADRTMITFLGVSAELSEREIDKYALKSSEWIYVEGYLVTNEATKVTAYNAVEFARNSDLKIALSLSDPFVVEMFTGALQNLIGAGVDLIFCNKQEAFTFSRTSNIEDAIDHLKLFSKTIVITDGANGAITFDGTSVSISKGVKVNAIDTNGAGDMFAGAFLHAITQGHDYHSAARLGNECAARVVKQFSPRLDMVDFTEIKRKLRL